MLRAARPAQVEPVREDKSVAPAQVDLTRSESLIDPAISQAKFAREIEAYRANEIEYRRRGWLLVRAEFPAVLVVMAAPQLRPSPMLYGLELNFTNYDLVAPSLRFVNPFTGQVLRVNEVQTVFQRKPAIPQGNVAAPAADDAHGAATDHADAQLDQQGEEQAFTIGNLVQGHGDHPAFLCVPGTREYHAHPFHSNDPWMAHRGQGPGTLYHLLNVVWSHGVAPLAGYQIQVNVAMVPQPDVDRIP